MDSDEQLEVGPSRLAQHELRRTRSRSKAAGFWTIAGVAIMLLVVWWAILNSVDAAELLHREGDPGGSASETADSTRQAGPFGVARPFDRAAVRGPGLLSADPSPMVPPSSMAIPAAGGNMPGSRLDVEVRDFKHQTSLVLVGDLDAHTASELEAVLEEIKPSATRVVLDLGGLEFIDSAGLGVVIRYDQQRDPGSVVLSNVNERVLKVLEYAGLLGHLTIE
jgi:anti-anti-sigma factor